MKTLDNVPHANWLTPTDVALPCKEGGYGISKDTQARMRMQKRIPFIKLSKFIRYDRHELDKWFREHTIVSA